MPIKPQPIQYTCRDCGWKTVYAPPSDAVLTPPPRNCGKCGSDDLERKMLTAVENIVETVSGLLRRL